MTEIFLLIDGRSGRLTIHTQRYALEIIFERWQYWWRRGTEGLFKLARNTRKTLAFMLAVIRRKLNFKKITGR